MTRKFGLFPSTVRVTVGGKASLNTENEGELAELLTWSKAMKGQSGGGLGWDPPCRNLFGVWADLQRANKPLELKAKIVAGVLKINAPPDSGIRVVNKHLMLDNGVEWVLTLEG